jgi:hypothetical protein
MSAHAVIPGPPPAAAVAVDPDWTAAACRGVGTDTFFADDPAETAVAKAVCRHCPIRAACLAYALATAPDYTPDLDGVWGGLTAEERVPLLRVRAECGTNDGFEIHLASREWTCPACRAARKRWVGRQEHRRAAVSAYRQRRRTARVGVA